MCIRFRQAMQDDEKCACSMHAIAHARGYVALTVQCHASVRNDEVAIHLVAIQPLCKIKESHSEMSAHRLDLDSSCCSGRPAGHVSKVTARSTARSLVTM